MGLPLSKTLFNYLPPVACKRAWQKGRGERKISLKDPCRKLREREGLQKKNFCQVFRSKAHRSRHWLLTRNLINTDSVGQEEWAFTKQQSRAPLRGNAAFFPFYICGSNSLRYAHAIDLEASKDLQCHCTKRTSLRRWWVRLREWRKVRSKKTAAVLRKDHNLHEPRKLVGNSNLVKLDTAHKT